MKTLLTAVFLLGALIVVNLSVDFWYSSRSRNESPHWQHALSDWFWIQGYDAWAGKDKERLLDNYSFATALHPENLTYWRLAAQTIAYDLPGWGEAPEAKTKYGQEALAFYERSREYFKTNPEWYLTGGFLAETACNDQHLAADYLKDAIALPDFPYLAGRTYARLLIETGEPEIARDFLVSWVPVLEKDPLESRQTEILGWISILENQLNSSVPVH